MAIQETDVDTARAPAGRLSAYGRVLVHVGRDSGNAARIAVGVALAERFQGKLVGGYLLPVIVPTAFAAGEIPAAFLIEQEKLAAEDADIAKQDFLGRAERAGLQSEWYCYRELAVSRLQRLARYTDIAVINQMDPDTPGATLGLRPEELIFASGRPAIIVPYIGAPPEIGRHIVIAWDGGREAARAVGDALPLLRDAQSVQILTIDAEAERGISSAGPGADLAGFLADHGIEASVHAHKTGDISAADLLLSQLADLGADLLVMGCYGHSRVRELLLGGMTRTILQHMTVPVFMSH